MVRKKLWPPGTEGVRAELGTRVLRWLWGVAVEPILDHLGFTSAPGELGEWPRIWWVPTGKVSQLPFHAAGIHKPGHSSSALDRVVSSYSSSIKALMYTQSNTGGQRRAGTHTQVVLASMSTTPGQRSLPHVGVEISAIKSALVGSAQVRELRNPLKQGVLAALMSCDVFHFAGHGASFIDDPDWSCLFLEDWETHRLTVRDILGLRLNKRAPWLAYLSACSTGANKAAGLDDEAIHLVTACQLAGFQHVIGSFWEVSDYRSREVARSVYTHPESGLEMTAAVMCRQ